MFPFPTFAMRAYDAPGTQTFSTPGAMSFTVPYFSGTITLDVVGGGSAGRNGRPFGTNGGCQTLAMPAGGASSIASLGLQGNGGSGSSGGTASGGDTNTTGGSGASGGIGGTAGGSGAGGLGLGNGGTGAARQGNDIEYGTWWCNGLSGGGGGKSTKTYTKATLPPGTVINGVVGAGGTAVSGGNGGSGGIRITWT